MALAYHQYLGDGVTRNFNVNFPYIARSHITLKVDGVQKTFTWLTSNTIRADEIPTDGAVVDVRRTTPRDKVLVDFVDGSTLVESDLDLSALQTFYLAQEAFDLGDASLGVTDDGSFSAFQRRISNVLDPILPQDVATKNFVETGVTSQVVTAKGYRDEAIAARDAALVAKGQSETAKAGSEAALASANSAKTAAQTAKSQAETAKTNAEAAVTAAAGHVASALGHVNTALSHANTANSHKNAASNSADFAAQKAQEAADSAALAGTFNPNSYYTKVTIDGYLSLKADASALASKADTSALSSYYTKTEADTLLSAKLNSNHTVVSNGILSNTTKNLTVGYTATAKNEGNGSGTFTPAPSTGNLKRIGNNAAFTFAAPTASNDYTMVVLITNASTAGAVTFTGFTKVTGDSLTVTNGHKFMVNIVKINNNTLASVVALQ